LSLDTSSVFPLPRLRGILSSSVPEDEVTLLLSQIHSLSIRSLPALLALFLHAGHTDTSIFAKVSNLSLVVIDDLSTPILASYPTGFEEDTSRTKSNRKDYANSDSSTKRTNVLKGLANKWATIAIKCNVAVYTDFQAKLKIGSGFKSAHDKGRVGQQCSSRALTW